MAIKTAALIGLVVLALIAGIEAREPQVGDYVAVTHTVAPGQISQFIASGTVTAYDDDFICMNVTSNYYIDSERVSHNDSKACPFDACFGKFTLIEIRWIEKPAP